MDRVCGWCAYMNPEVVKSGKYRCEKDDEWRYADSLDALNCYKFCERFWRDMDMVEEMIKNSRTSKSASNNESKCYITTVIVDILGLPDDCHELETLRMFRKEILSKNPKYKKILMTYDALGPSLAGAIKRDERRNAIAEDLFMIYIRGSVNYIENGNYDAAVTLYSEMTENLIANYITTYAVGKEAEKTYDQETGGHGSFIMKKAN